MRNCDIRIILIWKNGKKVRVKNLRVKIVAQHKDGKHPVIVNLIEEKKIYKKTTTTTTISNRKEKKSKFDVLLEKCYYENAKKKNSLFICRVTDCS